MIFLLTFLTIMALSYIMPYILRLLFFMRITTIKKRYNIYFVNSKLFPFDAIAIGFFNSKSVFIGRNYYNLLPDNFQEITLFHEIGHLHLNHTLYKSLITSLKYAIIFSILTLLFNNYQLLVSFFVLFIIYFIDYIVSITHKKIYHKYELEADKYAYFLTRFSASILEWYSMLEQLRESDTHPSLIARKKNIEDAIIHYNKKSNGTVN